jgi:hypothetical protein
MSFRVVCLVVPCVILVVFCSFIGWCVNDMRIKSGETLTGVRTLVANSKSGVETAVVISQDIKDFRSLVGVSKGGSDFVKYAEAVLDGIQASSSNSKIGVTEKMKDPEPTAEWVVGARREAAMVVMTSKSKEEILSRLCTTYPLRHDFFIQIGNDKPQRLLDWISAKLPAG